jgi:hypothetical protein
MAAGRCFVCSHRDSQPHKCEVCRWPGKQKLKQNKIGLNGRYTGHTEYAPTRTHYVLVSLDKKISQIQLAKNCKNCLSLIKYLSLMISATKI